IAIVKVLCRFDHAGFSTFLVLNGGQILSEFTNPAQPIQQIVADFLGWIKRDGNGLQDLLLALVAEAGASEEIAVLKQIVTRIKATQD
ncbi:hypothetical protein ACC728_37840, partial [Rhizobium ruizarguesonis]